VRSSLDPAALREAVARVLEEPRYREVTSALAAEMAAQPSADEALEALGLTAAR
jgi:UDP:flavonoid glycosyltransferase YjiC (YdhE family)